MYRTVATNLRTAGSQVCQKKALILAPKPQTLYEHYEGGKYKVLAIARHTETEGELVIYSDGDGAGVADSKVWARPLDMWNEMVDVNGIMVQRFREIETMK